MTTRRTSDTTYRLPDEVACERYDRRVNLWNSTCRAWRAGRATWPQVEQSRHKMHVAGRLL